MYHLYKKDPLCCTLVWLGIYCMVQSLGNMISAGIGIYKSANMVLALIQSIWMLCWLYRWDLLRTVRLKKPGRAARSMLYYLPLLLVSTANLWLGIRRTMTPTALGIHVLLMLSVGFQEEVIFRGFLLEPLKKYGTERAALISGLAFGTGHLLNLFNGSGTAAGEVFVQAVSAFLMGCLFAAVCLRCDSLIPCIISHQAINIFSAFADDQAPGTEILAVDLLVGAIILLYLFLLRKTAPVPAEENGERNAAE